ncbi:MFS transporter [Burkholderia sp. USMB20]|uniref:MFS transporter n=1 Tax=Burkholderia sp. USMB20 TaxID=1571773 RepID=UPI0005CE104B|nr:MFS transporter [Burkholderia sp. USMB20]TGN95691.1 MFS transporter [Burkholderia sp. USMB20]
MNVKGDMKNVGASRWTRIGLLLFITYLIAYADRSNIGVAAPQMAHDLSLGSTVTGALLSAFFLGYVVTQIPGGWLANRFGPTKVIAGAMVVTGITACLTGVVHDLRALIAVRVVMGLAEAAIWPAFSIMFVHWYPARERARGISFAQYSLPLSSVIMAPLAGWMIDAFHWRVMFILQGIPAIVVGLLVVVLLSDDPVKDRWLGTAERDYILKNRVRGVGADGSFCDVLKRPTVWLLSIVVFCWMMVVFSFMMWMPTLIREHFTSSGFGVVGWLTALPPLLGAVSMFVNSWLSDQPSNRSRGWFVAVPLAAAGIALIAQHYVNNSLILTICMFCIAGAGLYSANGTWWAWVLSNVPRNQVAPSVALISMFASFGGMVGPFAVGYFAQNGNLSHHFYILGYALFVAVATIGGVILTPSHPQYRSAVEDFPVH